MYSAHQDTFARDNLPPREWWPELLFDLPEYQFPEKLNCATELLDKHVAEGRGDRVCIRAEGLTWTYADLQEKANRIANVLVQKMGLVPGNRVLLRSANNPMLVACWFAVMKAGGIAVTTMPLLRVKELTPVVSVSQSTFALCDAALAEALLEAQEQEPVLQHLLFYNTDAADGLEALMAQVSPQFENVDTAAEDNCLFGFTSGTTGIPKATMHFHRDVMAICNGWAKHILKPVADDVFIGSPPLAFTFGLGGLVLFPMSVGASTVLLEKSTPEPLLAAVQEFGATILFTAPTAYRVLAGHGDVLRNGTLRKCVSAGESLPVATRTAWRDATGIELIDGIGATEMLHIFISHDESNVRPGATGKPVPGYKAAVLDDNGNEVPPGTVGRLAVKGPVGCRYLADDRQKVYVQNGWNVTGDAYVMDKDGYFYYQSRTDDLIISAGYNIAAIEVEEVLLMHPAVAECAVVGVADELRGQVVKAFVVLRAGHETGEAMVKALQDFAKQNAVPYKYPRQVAFVETLPRTSTGKLQRFRLHTEAETVS